MESRPSLTSNPAPPGIRELLSEGAEFEVTPEMIEVGADAYCYATKGHCEPDSPEEIAEAVSYAMERVRRAAR